MASLQITPELVLVDPDLRRELLLPARPDADAAGASGGGLQRPPASLRLTRNPTRPTRRAGRDWARRAELRRFGAACSLAALAVLAAIGLLSVIDRGQSAGTASSATNLAGKAEPPPVIRLQAVSMAAAMAIAATTSPASAERAPRASDRPKSSPPAAAGASTPETTRSVSPSPPDTPPRLEVDDFPVRRFAWAPVPGAAFYDFELHRQGAVVLTARTTLPTFEIPDTWRRAGRTHTLRPGRYVWYVWPVNGGRRAAEPVVASTLVV